jgi:uncharacterized protein YjlB
MALYPEIRAVMLEDDGTFPSHPRWPMLVYVGAYLPLGRDPATEIEARFERNGWVAAWRNGIYPYHHYHTTTHEALGVFRGRAKVQFGGPSGPVVAVKAGDAVLLPAGTAHKLTKASRDFAVTAAYPPGQEPDLCRGEPGERPGADQRVIAVPRPGADPVVGLQGGVCAEWSVVTS